MSILGPGEIFNKIIDAIELVEEVDEKMDDIEEIEKDASETLDDAEDMLVQINKKMDIIDSRLSGIDKLRKEVEWLQIKAEASVSFGAFLFSLQQYTEGNVSMSLTLFFFGLMFAGSLTTTIYKGPMAARARIVRTVRYLRRLLER
jgi:hypothetical protein